MTRGRSDKGSSQSGVPAQTWSEQIERLLRQADEHGVICAPGTQERLEAYCETLSSRARSAGLLSPRDLPHLVRKHVAASLGPLLLESPSAGTRWIDVGTGAGLPGMVLKLCRPETTMTLLDSSRKKVIFLERVRRQLGIADLEILEGRVEAWGGSADSPPPEGMEGSSDRPPPFDVVLMRAVAPLERSLRLIDGIAHAGTRLLTFKGRTWREEVDAAEDVLSLLGWRVVSALQIPWAAPRILKVVKVRP